MDSKISEDVGFSDVVIGRLLKVDPHPDADRLSVCSVDVGQNLPLQIVCGANNLYEGMFVAVALIGAILPGNLRIKRSRLRGVDSFGMLCSAKELELDEVSEGIVDLPHESIVGQPFEKKKS